MLVANLALVGALAVVGIRAHSLGVWAEGADYLADVAAIGLALVALRLAGRPSTPRHPDGFPLATRYAALVNAAWLTVVSVLVVAGAIERLATGVHRVDGEPVLVASAVAAVVMLAGALLLRGDPGDRRAAEAAAGDHAAEGADLSVQAVLLDTASDAAAAAGVAIAGGVIVATHGLYWLDPAVALAVAVVVGYHALAMVARARAALRTSPAAPA